ncbi:V-type ATPase 116kDa subunit family protein [uncultured Treponema sp.]|uniref:V-type ATP synthase subunit I n=1 Tax=uncultured Treponema sp. TaxID=162155 RepID=UPI0025CC6CA4|nr:V-type ATPase 116kDa subunit family protein [uncultured Treponema sp.]
MARTTSMNLVELMVMKDDIGSVLEFLGKKGNFQFQTHKSSGSDEKLENQERDLFLKLQDARSFLNIEDIDSAFVASASCAAAEDRKTAEKFIADVEELKKRQALATEELKRVQESKEEAESFKNLKVPFSELDHLSFLSIKIGKIDPNVFEDLNFSVGNRAIIVPLGDDKSKIMAASSKKARFSLDTELKKYGFVPFEIPSDFKGVPDDVIEGLDKKLAEAKKALDYINEEMNNMALAHTDLLRALLASFAISSQIVDVKNNLESTSLVYRITGWIPAADCHSMMKELDMLTEGRIAIRVYNPFEVPSVLNGTEQVPVRLKHGKLVGAFERMIFSYGSPVYGAIDPTPFVAIFFTILFGIMFGDAGQGSIFLLLGLLMNFKLIKVGGWNKFAPVFMAIGCSSMIMGLLTGEFFGNETILEPVAMAITGLFGEPHAPILHLMPNGSPHSIKMMFMFFGFTVGVGFIINSIGIIINVINNFLMHKVGKALFGKSGLSGAVFFWYVVVMAIRIAFFKYAIGTCDWIVIGTTLFLTMFSEPIHRLLEHERTVLENGLFAAVIEAVVELLETVISYLSSTISFVRVGAFGLAHAVLGFIILTLSEMAGPAYLAVMLVGNAIVVVLEGMIVAIQVIRLQYYEFFSKFFNETGREFKPFSFDYK